MYFAVNYVGLFSGSIGANILGLILIIASLDVYDRLKISVAHKEHSDVG